MTTEIVHLFDKIWETAHEKEEDSHEISLLKEQYDILKIYVAELDEKNAMEEAVDRKKHEEREPDEPYHGFCRPIIMPLLEQGIFPYKGIRIKIKIA